MQIIVLCNAIQIKEIKDNYKRGKKFGSYGEKLRKYVSQGRRYMFKTVIFINDGKERILHYLRPPADSDRRICP